MTKQKNAVKALKIILWEVCMVLINTMETAGAVGTPPAMDCATLSLNMAAVLSYITTGSTARAPEAKVCSGLKLEMKVDADCFCEGLRNTAQFGLTLNITRAVGLPAACHFLAPSVSDCGLNYNMLGSSLGPAESPRASPPKPIREYPSTPELVSPPHTASSSSTAMVGAFGYYLQLLFMLFILLWR